MSSPGETVIGTPERDPFRLGLSRSSISVVLIATGACVTWTVAVVVWLAPSRLSGIQASARAETVLTTMATLSGAAIVLALTAILIGLQLSSRFGARASRTVTTRPVAALMGVAAFLGVAVPLGAAAEPWRWFRTAALAVFAWTILALGIVGSRVLTHLNPRWLAVHQIDRLYPLLVPGSLSGLACLHEAQSVLLEIADGAAEGDADGNAARRALAYAALAGYRLTNLSEDLSELTATLGARARTAAHRGESPMSTAGVLTLIGLASDNADVCVSVLRELSDLAHDAIAQRREPVVRALLDEAASFATDCLQTLVEPSAIAWLAEQEPIKHTAGLHLNLPDKEEKSTLTRSTLSGRGVDRRAVLAWIDNTSPATRRDVDALVALLPPAAIAKPAERVEAEVVETISTLVEPPPGVASGAPAEEPIVVADLADYLTDGVSMTASASDASAVSERAEEEWQATLTSRSRGSDAYDLLEATVEAFVAAVAAPSPDDHGWPGGWRGSGAFIADIARIAAPELSLYQSGRYPPTDRAEAAIEDQVLRLVRMQQSEPMSDLPPDPIGWRTPETTLRPTAASEATAALRELAIEAWRAGFTRRTLLNVRRLIAVFTVVVSQGDTNRLEDVAENLRRVVIRTAQWGDGTIAERQESRVLVLALAPELSTLGREVAQLNNVATWESIFGVLDTIGWSPRGSAAEAVAEIYLHVLAGLGAPSDEPYFGRPWDLVSWGCHPLSPAEQLPDHVRLQLRRELKMSGTLEEPRLAVLSILALWRDAIASDTAESTDALRDTLRERILDHGRRDFQIDELWDPEEIAQDRPPRFGQALVHWRVYDVALAASRWAEGPASGDTAKPVLPPVITPDSDLLAMIENQGGQSLVDEREYWGVEYGEDELVLIQEADRSRRLLRDCECRARSRINWGYGGSGPHDLAALLVADTLGPLAYCPSCFGTIGVAAGLIQCPVCENGMRPGLWEMQRACNWLTSRLAQAPGLIRMTDDTPPGAQWHLRRTDLLDFVVRKIAEFSAEADSEDAQDNSGGEG
jgi:hypothetical protein